MLSSTFMTGGRPRIRNRVINTQKHTTKIRCARVTGDNVGWQHLNIFVLRLMNSGVHKKKHASSEY